MRDEALRRALAARGNSARIAEAIGVTTGAIAQWTRCPAEHARVVEAITGVSRHELRPDLWETAVMQSTDALPAAAGSSRGPALKESLSPVDDGAATSPVRSALEEAQAILRRYVDPSDSLSAELIRDRREAAARGE